eukprot:TRINITY_DN7363_c0_g1_i2.p2 TRINITY_DN7363_c0_g1~~TRINITY_DN7363_c0_g1_i2.p2  ORF type:complete len:418 (+),score=120.17 TRINITY_DN7363_c0_g1_i2:82-1254(+)
MYAKSECSKEAQNYFKSHPNDSQWKYFGFPPYHDCAMKHNCLETYCGGKSSQVDLYLIDEDKEREMELGRSWNLPKLSKEGQFHLSQDVASELSLDSNNPSAILSFETNHILGRKLWDSILFNESSIDSNIEASLMDVSFVSSFDNPMGKFPETVNRAMIMSINTFVKYWSEQIDPTFSQSIKTKASQAKIEEHISKLLVNIPPSDRMKFYITTDYDLVQARVTQFGADLSYKLGFSELETTTPLIPYLFAFRFLVIFLGLIFNIVIAVLLFISVILIYSLLSTTMESRTFETAVHRMFGMRSHQVITLLLFQALSYSVVAFPIGVITSQGIAYFLINLLELHWSILFPSSHTLFHRCCWIHLFLNSFGFFYHSNKSCAFFIFGIWTFNL